MKMRLDKWYFDCRAGDEFGYYYVTRLRIGRVGLISTEIHHGGGSTPLRQFRIGRERGSSLRSMRGAGADVRAGRGRTDLRIAGREGVLAGSWTSRTPPPPRPGGLLYEDEHGWCDWKLWTPHADVDLQVPGGRLHGTGYADFVRFAFPFWRVPIRSIHWGHLSDGDRTIVLFQMRTRGGTLAWAQSGDGWRSDVTTTTSHGPAGVCAFDWRVGGRRIRAETIRTLERGTILNHERLGRCLPASILRRLGSGGFEEKCWVQSRIGGATFAGPMEEVRFDAR